MRVTEIDAAILQATAASFRATEAAAEWRHEPATQTQYQQEKRKFKAKPPPLERVLSTDAAEEMILGWAGSRESVGHASPPRDPPLSHRTAPADYDRLPAQMGGAGVLSPRAQGVAPFGSSLITWG